MKIKFASVQVLITFVAEGGLALPMVIGMARALRWLERDDWLEGIIKI